MKYVKITKLNVAENALIASAENEGWKHGQDNELSPPVGYSLEGYLFNDIEVGTAIVVDRRVRNGVPMVGLFRSSIVTSFDGSIATTKNSQYLIEEV